MDKFDLKKYLTESKMLEESIKGIRSDGSLDLRLEDTLGDLIDNKDEAIDVIEYIATSWGINIEFGRLGVDLSEDREAEEMAVGMPPRQGSEKDKEIKSKSFTVNSEYGGENYQLSYDERLDSPLRDMLEDTLKISNNKEDFIGKMTYALTDSTSVLSLEDQDKLGDWYDSRILKNVELDKDIEDSPKSIEGSSNIDKLKDEYELLYSEKYPSGARRAGFKHRSTLGNDRYGDLYFHSNWPREFRHEDEYDNMSDDKQDILAQVEEFEFEVDKLFDKYGVPQNSHAG